MHKVSENDTFCTYYTMTESKKIDWRKINERITCVAHLSKDDELYNLEQCVHEFVHVYDCIGQQAFSWKGDNHQVAKLIERTYSTVIEQDLAEINVSTITYLILESYGELKIDVLQSCAANVSFGTVMREKRFEQITKLFDQFCLKIQNIKAAEEIKTFLENL